jgi:hypothetical protein
VQLGIHKVTHLSDEIPNLPLRSGAETFVCHVNQFPEIAGQIQGSGTSVGENVPSILIGNTVCLVIGIPFLNGFHISCKQPSVDTLRCYVFEPVLGAVPLTPLGEAAMSVSNQLVGTGTGDSFNLEGKVNMLHYRHMTVIVEVLYQTNGVLRITVIADRSNRCDGLNGVGSSLYKSYFHDYFSSVK